MIFLRQKLVTSVTCDKIRTPRSVFEHRLTTIYSIKITLKRVWLYVCHLVTISSRLYCIKPFGVLHLLKYTLTCMYHHDHVYVSTITTLESAVIYSITVGTATNSWPWTLLVGCTSPVMYQYVRVSEFGWCPKTVLVALWSGVLPLWTLIVFCAIKLYKFMEVSHSETA